MDKKEPHTHTHTHTHTQVPIITDWKLKAVKDSLVIVTDHYLFVLMTEVVVAARWSPIKFRSYVLKLLYLKCLFSNAYIFTISNTFLLLQFSSSMNSISNNMTSLNEHVPDTVKIIYLNPIKVYIVDNFISLWKVRGRMITDGLITCLWLHSY